MVLAAFAAPYLLDATTRFVDAAASVPDAELALITCEPEERLPGELRRRLAGHLGPVQRLLAVLEQLQEPLGQVREHLGIAGMDAATARNFRDKAQMKSVLRAAAVPAGRLRKRGGRLRCRGRLSTGGQAAGRCRGEEHVPSR